MNMKAFFLSRLIFVSLQDNKQIISYGLPAVRVQVLMRLCCPITFLSSYNFGPLAQYHMAGVVFTKTSIFYAKQ